MWWRAANDAYRSEMDLVTAFVEECCVEDVSKKVRLKDLYDVYIAWCVDNGLSPLSSKRMKQELTGRGYERLGIRRVIKCLFLD